MRFLAVRGLQAVIDKEEREGSALAVALLAEPRCLRAVHAALASLSLLLLGCLPLSSSGTAPLRACLREAIHLGLRHSGVDPRCLRELQTLLWALEATAAGAPLDANPNPSPNPAGAPLDAADAPTRHNHNHNLSAVQLGALVRSCLPGLAALRHSLSCRSLGNALEKLPLGYGSASLAETLRGSRTIGRRDGVVLTPRQAVMSGPSRAATCLELEAVLMHLDATALYEGAAGAGIGAGGGGSRAGGGGSAVVTLKGCGAARARLLRLFALAAAPEDWGTPTSNPHPTLHPKNSHNAITGPSGGSEAGLLPSLPSLPSLPELLLLALDIAHACRSFLPDTATQTVSRLRQSLTLTPTLTPNLTLPQSPVQATLMQAVFDLLELGSEPGLGRGLGLGLGSLVHLDGAAPHPRELLALLFRPALLLLIEAHIPEAPAPAAPGFHPSPNPSSNPSPNPSSNPSLNPSAASIAAQDRAQVLIACAAALLSLLQVCRYTDLQPHTLKAD